MLNFERDNGKIQFYPCNALEGSNIVAVAAFTKERESNGTVESDKKIWLSHGIKSVYNHNIPPMFLPDEILDQMAKSSSREE